MVNGVVVFVGGSSEFCADNQLAGVFVVDVVRGLAAPDLDLSPVAQFYDMHNICRAVWVCVVDFCDLNIHFLLGLVGELVCWEIWL